MPEKQEGGAQRLYNLKRPIKNIKRDTFLDSIVPCFADNGIKVVKEHSYLAESVRHTARRMELNLHSRSFVLPFRPDLKNRRYIKSLYEALANFQG